MPTAKQRYNPPHTRAIRVAQSKHVPAAPLDAALSERLRELVLPAVYAQLGYYRQLGLRERVLGLPVMVALVLSLIWQQVGSACELVRMLAQEGLLWVGPLHVSQQALSQRLLSFPASLFERVVQDLLPRLEQRWQQRMRPLPPDVAWAQQQYGRVLIFDGSTLDNLWRKLKALRSRPDVPLAGRMGALLALGSRLPVQLWYDDDARGNDYQFRARLQAELRPRDLIVFDVGLRHYGFFTHLTEHQVTFLTRAASNIVLRVSRVLSQTAGLRDELVWVGAPGHNQCAYPLRLVSRLYRGQWYRYLSNELDPLRLPPEMLVSLYRRRWRIEVAFLLVKRLLGLAYLWVGSTNGVQLQLWATWLLYACLIDLSDAVAEQLDCLSETLSVEMVFRALYHFTQAALRDPSLDPVRYLADHARSLNLLKRQRPARASPLLVT